MRLDAGSSPLGGHLAMPPPPPGWGGIPGMGGDGQQGGGGGRVSCPWALVDKVIFSPYMTPNGQEDCVLEPSCWRQSDKAILRRALE